MIWVGRAHLFGCWPGSAGAGPPEWTLRWEDAQTGARIGWPSCSPRGAPLRPSPRRASQCPPAARAAPLHPTALPHRRHPHPAPSSPAAACPPGAPPRAASRAKSACDTPRQKRPAVKQGEHRCTSSCSTNHQRTTAHASIRTGRSRKHLP